MTSEASARVGTLRFAHPTRLRDITQLLEAGVLKKSPGGGRSTSYELTR